MIINWWNKNDFQAKDTIRVIQKSQKKFMMDRKFNFFKLDMTLILSNLDFGLQMTLIIQVSFGGLQAF